MGGGREITMKRLYGLAGYYKKEHNKKIIMCLHNPDLPRGHALVSGKVMDCHNCLKLQECKAQDKKVI